uniref:adhesion G-protein coupled receptor G5-like n=1 Tax=Epinephelus lanceolatus TaxID=310571 RepID=UPI00144559A9|nr:adhesion G-protein coupled receptor G5-like [Epinephelus lanceolatus]
MEPRLTDNLRVVFILIILLSTGFSENDLDWNFCGTWRHGKGPLSLNVNLSTGCSGISISANQSSLSIDGQITAQCRRSEVILVKELGLESEEENQFCLYWEPLLDQLMLQVGGKNLYLCWPTSLQGSCCTDLTDGGYSTPGAAYGLMNVMVKADYITDKIRTAYMFSGYSINCKALCDQESQGSSQVNMTKETAGMAWAGGTMHSLCAHSSEVEMKEDFRGYSITSPASKGASTESTTTVYIPHALKQASKKTSKVICTFFKNKFLCPKGHRILVDVVGITAENKVITDLSEPIRIVFHHNVIPKIYSRKCVSWDTGKAPSQVTWLVDGCKTQQKGANQTECLCNHLGYFTVFGQMKPRPVRPLLAQTIITSLGCAMSVISCVTFIIFLCRKRRSREQSISIHLGLAVSLAFLNLLFFFTGDVANMGESACTWVGAGLHYTLLSSFTWMGIEVFHTFRLIYVGFSPSHKPYIENLVGFGLPVAPIIILARVGDIYGVKEVGPNEDASNLYLMCWMKQTHKGLLAHCFTNLTILAILVFSGIVMLFLVNREIRTRDEWRQNRSAFLSLWGLICLFGTTWGLTFLDFGPVFFHSCIFNSFQGFTLMLRLYMLDWMQEETDGSALDSTSTGSTRQHMLHAQEMS